jgi:DNA-directed RNA polymerase subunit RPC12/RpoP
MTKLYKQRISEMGEQLDKLLSAPFMFFTEGNADAIPEAPGIYLIKEDDKIVYSGSAQNLRLRLWQEHYLGEQVRMGGSQFRGVLSRVYPSLRDNKEITQHIGKHCSFTFIKIDPVEKRELNFIEEFCNSILRPDFIKYGAKGKVWATSRRREPYIIYKCDDCGNEFPSGRQRSGPKFCRNCAEKRRREGRGPRQQRKNA